MISLNVVANCQSNSPALRSQVVPILIPPALENAGTDASIASAVASFSRRRDHRTGSARTKNLVTGRLRNRIVPGIMKREGKIDVACDTWKSTSVSSHLVHSGGHGVHVSFCGGCEISRKRQIQKSAASPWECITGFGARRGMVETAVVELVGFVGPKFRQEQGMASQTLSEEKLAELKELAHGWGKIIAEAA